MQAWPHARLTCQCQALLVADGPGSAVAVLPLHGKIAYPDGVGSFLDFLVGLLHPEILRRGNGEFVADFVNVCIIHIYDRVRPRVRERRIALLLYRRFFEGKLA